MPPIVPAGPCERAAGRRAHEGVPVGHESRVDDASGTGPALVPARPGATGPGLPPQGVAEPDRDLARVRVDLAARVAERTSLTDVVGDASVVTDIRDSLADVLHLCLHVLSGEQGVLLLHDEAAGHLLPVARAGGALRPGGLDAVPSSLLDGLRTPLHVEDPGADPRLSALSRLAGVEGCPAVVALPMVTAGDELLGLVVVCLAAAGPPPEGAVDVAFAQARQGAEFVARARLHGQARRVAEQERARSAQLRQLAEVAMSLTRARDLDEVLRTVTEAARATVGAHQSVTSRLPDGWAQATTYVSLSDKYAQWRTYDTPPKGLGVLNHVTRHNTPVRLTPEELVQHPEWRGLADAPGHPPLPDYLAAPLIARDGSNLGLVQLSDKVDGTPFSEEDEAILVQLAQAASGAIETLELLEAEGVRARVADQAARVAAAVADATDPSEVVELLVQQGRDLLGATASMVSLLQDGRLVVAGAAGLPEELLAQVRSVDLDGAVPFAQAVRSREPVFLPSRDAFLAAYPEAAEALAVSQQHAWAFLPLLSAGTIVGGWVVTYEQARRFPAEERLGLSSLAGTAAQALDRTRRHQAEHEMADALQRALLPDRLPAVGHAEVAVHYLPAAADVQVGGDWYDAVALPGGAVALVVGDVQGHSAEAAALMGQVRLALRAYAAEDHPPAEVLRRTNRLFTALDAGRFATCCYVVLEPDGRLEVVRAGHPLPVLVPGDGGPPVLLEAEGGLPLGIDEDETWPVSSFRLAPGDRLLLHTDGLVEPLRTASAPDGTAALLTALADSGVGARGALQSALSLLDGVPGRPDDVAVLALQYGASAAPGLVVPPDLAAVRQARGFVRDRCLKAGLDEDVVDTAVLLASELVTNALRHGGGSARVDVTTGAGTVRVSVGDDDPSRPAPVDAADDALGGRGLAILDALARRWGVDDAPLGKVVWFEVGGPVDRRAAG
jgi:GAF domain-containing protein/anti-sigma regulatory factor (Ser/Thr protein kinase)